MPFSVARFISLIAGVVLMLGGCQQHSSQRAKVVWRQAAFAAACQHATTIHLPITRGAGFPASVDRVSRVDSSVLAMIDSRGSRVVLFREDGSFVSSFGSIGDGPGEFRLPGDIAVANDSFVVVDPAQMRVTFFSREGRVGRTFPTRRFAGRRLAALPGRRFAVAGLSDMGEGFQLLAVYTDEGSLVGTPLPAPEELTRLTPSVDDAVMSVDSGGTLYYMHAVQDRLVVLHGDSIELHPLDLPESAWTQLRHREEPPKTPMEMKAWFDSASVLTAGGTVGPSTFVLAWHTGRGEGERDEMAVYDLPTRSGTRLTGVPGWVLGIDGQRLWIKGVALSESNRIEGYACQL